MIGCGWNPSLLAGVSSSIEVCSEKSILEVRVIDLALEYFVYRCRPTCLSPQTQLGRSKMPCQAVVTQRGMRASQCLGVRGAVGS